MSKILRHTEKEEIEYFLSNNDKVSAKLKEVIKSELKKKEEHWTKNFIWLIARNEALTIDVFDMKGDTIETESFYYKDYSL